MLHGSLFVNIVLSSTAGDREKVLGLEYCLFWNWIWGRTIKAGRVAMRQASV